MADKLISTTCGHLHLPTNFAKEGLDLYRELKAMNTGLGMNASMEAVLCLNLVADRKGHPVDIKLFQKLAGAKSKPIYYNTLQNVQKRLGIGESLTLQEIGVQLGIPPHVLSQTRELIQAYKKQFAGTQNSDIDFEKVVYLCSALHAVAKQNKQKIDSAKLFELAKSTKKDVIGKSDEMTKILIDLSAKSSSGKLPLKILQEDETADNIKAVEAAKRKHEEENDLDEAESFKRWRQEIIRKAVDAGFKQYKQFLQTSK